MGRNYWLTMVPLSGTTNLLRLQENIGGTNIFLSDNELNKINAVLATIKILGRPLSCYNADENWFIQEVLFMSNLRNHLKCCIHHQNFGQNAPVQLTIAASLYSPFL